MRDGTETANDVKRKADYQESSEQQMILNVIDVFNQNLKTTKIEEQYSVHISINQKHFTKLIGVTQRKDLQIVAKLVWQYNDDKRKILVTETVFNAKCLVGDKTSNNAPSKEEIENGIRHCFKVLMYEAMGTFCIAAKQRKLTTGKHENG